MANGSLSAEQLHALFDVLTHKATYDEICRFKQPDAIQQYGRPFQDDLKTTSPLLQMLVANFALTLPGLRDVSLDFWKIRVEKLIENLSAAELSESYDKGVLGIRKTCATAISALVEYPIRGCVGGFVKDEEALKERKYDPTDPEDVLRAFHAFLQQLVYGDLWNQLFEKTAKTDKLSDQSSLVQSAHEYILVNLASFMHYTLVLSPEGPSILRMVENINKLAPYTLIRGTLKVGNVATMISGMVRLLLAKASVGSITNWIGLSKEADEGMNLLQTIISTVLAWDRRELKKRVDKLDKDKDGPPSEVKKALDEWIASSREVHEECRRRSQDQSMSIVAVILSLSSAGTELTDTQHEKALQYLALQLGIRDRKEIVRVLCSSNPDHLTQGIKDGVTAYEPMIRQVHQAVDLSQTVSDFEAFVNDMIKMSKRGKGGEAPSVEDYVKLLHSHMASTHRFLHQVAKNGTEVTGWFKEYCVKASKYFQRTTDASSFSSSSSSSSSSSQSVEEALASEFDKLPAGEQEKVRDELDSFSRYLKDLHSSSAARIRDVLANKTSTAYGPGAYLARWQDLLDSTLVTPDKANGPIRRGANRAVKDEARRNVDGGTPETGVDTKNADAVVGSRTTTPDAPGMTKTLELMGPKFRNMLLERVSPVAGLQV